MKELALVFVTSEGTAYYGRFDDQGCIQGFHAFSAGPQGFTTQIEQDEVVVCEYGNDEPDCDFTMMPMYTFRVSSAFREGATAHEFVTATGRRPQDFAELYQKSLEMIKASEHSLH